MPKKIALLLAQGFEEIEALLPTDLLRRANIEVYLISIHSEKEVRGSHNITIKSDLRLDELEKHNFLDYDALYLPGGMTGAKNLASHHKVIELVNLFYESKKLLVAICASPFIVLGEKTDILTQENFTCYPSFRSSFNQKIINNYKLENVVKSGNLITSQGVYTSPFLAFKLIEELISLEASLKVQQETLYPL